VTIAPPGPPAPRDDDLDRHVLAAAKGSGFLAGGSFFEFASRFVIAVLLARLLGAHDYGLYVLAVSAAGIFAGFASLGLDDAMVRYVAILSGRRDSAGVRGTIQVGLGISLAAGVVTGAVLLLAAGPIATGMFNEPRLASLLRLVAVIVPFLTMSNVLAGTARGFGRMDYAAFSENVVQSLVRLVLLALVAVVARGLNVFTAAVIFAISDVAATLTFVVLLHRNLLDASLLSHARRDVREVFSFAIPLWLSGLLRQFRSYFETVLLGISKAVSSVGIYAIVDKINLVSHVWLLSIYLAVKPTLARLHDLRDHHALQHLYVTVTKWSLTLTLPFLLVTVMYREAILSLFGTSFAAGSTALVVLSVAELANAGTGICGPVIDMTGHTRVKVANAALMTVLLIASNAVLIPRWGVVGAATATLIGIAVVNIVTVVEVWFLERLYPFDRSFWKPSAAAVGAVGAGLLLGLWFPVGDNVVRAAVSALVVAAAYGGLLLVFGLPSEDRLVIRRLLDRMVRLRERVHARRATRRTAVPAAPAAASTEPAPAAAGPIYIGGLDRSGKTTMAAFLTSHPRIAVPPVGSNMWTYFYGRYGSLAKTRNFERCLDAMLRYKHVQALEPDPDRLRREFADGPATYARLFELFLAHYAEREGKPRWGVQTGLIERYAPQLFAADPRTKVIHMVRDPRDRYEGSLALWPGGRGRAGGATARWKYSMRLAQRNLRRHPDAYHVVRYEDLVLHTEATLREVCAFVGEDFVPEMLAMPGAPERRERLARNVPVEAECPLSDAFIGRFRGVVPPHEVAFIQLHARRLMRTYGYAPEPVDLSSREWARFVTLGWPSQAVRMTGWRGVEALQQRLPNVVGRKPDPRTVVAAAGTGR
jgi:O-antigen/teichoic acid export membrane protein